MKFYGNGVVWDGKANFQLMKFVNGSYETEDLYICDRLIELGYKHDGKFESLETVTKEFEKDIESKPKKSRRTKE